MHLPQSFHPYSPPMLPQILLTPLMSLDAPSHTPLYPEDPTWHSAIILNPSPLGHSILCTVLSKRAGLHSLSGTPPPNTPPLDPPSFPPRHCPRVQPPPQDTFSRHITPNPYLVKFQPLKTPTLVPIPQDSYPRAPIFPSNPKTSAQVHPCPSSKNPNLLPLPPVTLSTGTVSL
jgi:hypothetical protein